MHRKITACSNTARLNAEIRDAMEHQDSMVHLQVDEDNIYHWTAYIKGPDFTPYEKGTFILKITCDSSFPITPPSVTFKTPVFHPNINSQTGEVCMDVLKEAWSPIWTLSCLCRAIISLLEDPNPHSPLCCDAVF
ncbi:uncharacterized protein LOC128883460 [Hylaeus volcanicus]|uniref:uncharacterized protein LOC128883460 n=1 Tax=Hylaeus volcanicus TaxID=313075 RepID=UPI0023B82663|nr:uncharacterized protein LOC128883460 [Hylaeus volcanicus]